VFGNGRGFGGGIPVTFRSASDPAKCAGSFSCGRAASGHCAVEQRDEVAPLHSITFVGAGEQRRRNLQAQRLRGFEIDHEFVLGRRLHRQVSRLVALENAPSIDPCLMIRFGLTAAVADQIVDNTGIPTRAPTAEAGAVSRIIAPTLLTLRTRAFEPRDATARRMSPGPQWGLV